MNPFVYKPIEDNTSKLSEKLKRISTILTSSGPKTFSSDSTFLLQELPSTEQQTIAEFKSPVLIENPYVPETNLSEHTGENGIPQITSIVPKLGKIEFASNDLNVGNMSDLLNLFVKEGIDVRVTSGVRKGAKTKSGRTSYHSSGDAIDIVPINGETFESLLSKIKGSKKIVSYMKEHGLGLIDETTSEMMRKTGATGAHFHIGKDKAGQVFFGQNGFKIPFKYEGEPIKWDLFETQTPAQKGYTTPFTYDYTYPKYYDEKDPGAVYHPKTRHWDSRNPETGLILKHPNHPTFHKTMQGEREAGMRVYHNLGDDRYYSFEENDPRIKQMLAKEDVTDKLTWFEKVTKFQNAFEDHIEVAKPVPQEDKSKPKQWLVGYGLSRIYDYNEKRWRPVREGDKLTKAQAEAQREKWYEEIFREELNRLKLYHFDEYPEELKFQIFDLLYNTSGIERDEAGNRTTYMQALMDYESRRGFNSNRYDLRKILEHADWSLNHKRKDGGHSSLGLRSVMRRNPSVIDYSDLEHSLNKDKWDELWDKYNDIWNQ